jgi:hypothetical protein
MRSSPFDAKMRRGKKTRSTLWEERVSGLIASRETSKERQRYEDQIDLRTAVKRNVSNLPQGREECG